MPHKEAAALVRLRRTERARLRTARTLRLWQASPLCHLLRALRETLAMTDLRVLSLLIAPMGLASLFRCLILPLLTDDFPLLVADGIAGVFLSVLSLLLITYRAPMARALQEDGLLSRFFFDTLALPRPHPSDRSGLSARLAFPIGIGLAVLSVYLSPLLLTGILAALIFLFLTLISPEFGIAVIGIVFPLAPLLPFPSFLLPIAVILTLLSYLLKLMVGKRRFAFDATDLLVLLFALAMLLSGLFSRAGIAEGGKAAGIATVLTVGGYLLAANLLVTRRMLLLFSRGILFTAALLALVGIFRTVLALTSPVWMTHEAVLFVTTRFDAIFPNNDVHASYILLLFPLLLGVMAETRRARWRYLPTLLLLLAALVLTLSATALISLLFSLLFFALLLSRSHARWLILLVAILPNILILLPTATLHELVSLLSFLGNEELLLAHIAAWKQGLLLLVRYPFGIGMGHGQEVLTALFGEGATAENLGLHLAAEMGLPTLFVFLILLVAVLRGSLALRKLESENRFRIFSVGATASVFSFLVFGVASYPFASPAILLLFFLVLGLLTAARRVANEEEEGFSLTRPTDIATATTEVRIARRRTGGREV